MPQSLRTTYITHDIDSGTLVLGYFQETPFYCAKISSDVTVPLTTDAILITDPPADLNGPHYIEQLVEASAGSTATGHVEETFTYIQSKGFRFAGIVQVQPNFTIDLDQCDETYGGAVNVESVVVELIKKDLNGTDDVSFGVQTHTINKGLSGNDVSVSYAEPSLTDLFVYDVGLTPIEIGQTPGFVIQIRIRVNFSAYTHTSALTTTIGKCRLNCYQDLTRTSKLMLAVV